MHDALMAVPAAFITVLTLTVGGHAVWTERRAAARREQA